MSNRYLLSYVDGARGHFLYNILFTEEYLTEIPDSEIKHGYFDPSSLTHDFDVSKLKTQYSNKEIIVVTVDDWTHTEFLQWTKVGKYLIEELKGIYNWQDQILALLIEIEQHYNNWKLSKNFYHLADHTIDFSQTDNKDYLIDQHLKFSNNKYASEKLVNYIDTYIKKQPDIIKGLQNMSDPVAVSIQLSKFMFENNLKHPLWSIRDRLHKDMSNLEFFDLLKIDLFVPNND